MHLYTGARKGVTSTACQKLYNLLGFVSLIWAIEWFQSNSPWLTEWIDWTRIDRLPIVGTVRTMIVSLHWSSFREYKTVLDQSKPLPPSSSNWQTKPTSNNGQTAGHSPSDRMSKVLRVLWPPELSPNQWELTPAEQVTQGGIHKQHISQIWSCPLKVLLLFNSKNTKGRTICFPYMTSDRKHGEPITDSTSRCMCKPDPIHGNDSNQDTTWQA